MSGGWQTAQVVRHAAVRRRSGPDGGCHPIESRFFRPADVSGAATPHSGREWDWGAIVARLIRAGHRWGDIPGYTLSQIKLFIREVTILEREEAAQRLAHGYMAANADGDKINDAIRVLTTPAEK
jgi:hypothetical protein